MPATILEYTIAAQDRTLELVRQSQATVLEAVENWAKTVEGTVPELPELPEIPYAKELPSPAELVTTSFDFYGKLLSAQREFATNLLSDSAPAFKPKAVVSA